MEKRRRGTRNPVRNKPGKFRIEAYSTALSRWLFAAIFASVLCAIEEFAAVSLHFPPSGSDALGTATWLLGVASTAFALTAAVGAIAAAFEAMGVKNPLSDAGVVAGLLLCGMVVTGLVALVLSVFERRSVLEFPDEIRLMRLLVLLGVAQFGVFVGYLFITPMVRRWFRHLTFLRSARLVLGSALFAASVALLLFANFVMARVHANQEILALSLSALCAALFAGRLWSPAVSGRSRWFLFGAGFVLLLVGPLFARRHPHGSFVLFGHSHGVSALAGLQRDLLDFDGDGASSKLWGGADCDEFNKLVGPGRREKVADGIDQDCRGGDARPSGAPPSRSPFQNCAATPGPMNVLLISVDALRADSVQPQFTPNLWSLMSRMVRFSRAYAPATSTMYSFGSMFAGRSASDASGEDPIGTDLFDMGTTLAARFRHAGYETVFFEPDTLPRVFQTGFSHHNPYRDTFDLHAIPAKAVFSGAGLTTGAIATLEAMRGRKLFMWLHYLDVHAPYVTPLGDAPAAAVHPYDGLVQYVDHQLGRFLKKVQEEGLLEKTIIVVTADHGEGLGQHGREGHGADLFEEVVHVPLVVWIPGCPGQTIEEPVSLIHLGATLGQLTGVEVPGRPLSAASDLPVVTEVVRVQGQLKRAVVSERYKMIVDVRNGGKMLFDLKEDPGETRDIYAQCPAEARRMEQNYQKWLDRPGTR